MSDIYVRYFLDATNNITARTSSEKKHSISFDGKRQLVYKVFPAITNKIEGVVTNESVAY